MSTTDQSLRVDVRKENLPSRKDVKVDIWWRNPWNYILQLRDAASAFNTIWRIETVSRYNLNVQAFLNLNLGVNSGWRAIVVDREKGLALEYRAGFRQHVAVYPVWRADIDSQKKLIDYINNPVSEGGSSSLREHVTSIPKDQEHRIIITGIGSIVVKYWKSILENVSRIQEEYPEVKLLLSDSYSYTSMFGKSFREAGVDPVTPAKTGSKITLPSGKECVIDDPELYIHSNWLRVIGYDKSLLRLPRKNRTYKLVSVNINSAEWASRYFKDLTYKVPVSGAGTPDWRSPEADYYTSNTKNIYTGVKHGEETDRIVCDSCTLWSSCYYYRKGGVCTLPGSDMENVAKMFGSKDADVIIDAMGKLLTISAERIQDARSAEEADYSGLDPDLTKLVNSTLSNAEKLAKLRKPELAGGKASVIINNQNTQQGVLASGATRDNSITPAVAMHIVNQLEAQGHAREDITEELIQDYLTRATARQLPVNKKNRPALDTEIVE